jgi:hypothetical protein
LLLAPNRWEGLPSLGGMPYGLRERDGAANRLPNLWEGLASITPTDFPTLPPHTPDFPHWEKCGEAHNRLGESEL